MIFVCSYGCVVGQLKTGLYKLNGGSGRRHAVFIPASLPGPTRPPDPLHIRKNTQKSKFLLSQAFKLEKNDVFRNPRDAI